MASGCSTFESSSEGPSERVHFVLVPVGHEASTARTSLSAVEKEPCSRTRRAAGEAALCSRIGENWQCGKEERACSVTTAMTKATIDGGEKAMARVGSGGNGAIVVLAV